MAGRRLVFRPRVLTNAQKRRLIRERDGDDCYVCGEAIDFELEPGTPGGPSLEHVIPRKMFGRDQPDNMKLSHTQCNRDRDYAEIGDDVLDSWRKQTRGQA